MKNKYILIILLLYSIVTYSQTTGPSLEFAKIIGDNNPTGNGPTNNTAIHFVRNSDNPTGTTYGVYSPTLTASFALTNHQYNTTISSGGAVAVGYAGSATGIFRLMNAAGSPSNGNFTSSGATTGNGITINSNRGVLFQILSYPLRSNNAPTNGRYYMADLTITFNRPVNNPILHLGGLGGATFTQSTEAKLLGYSAEFDVTANVPVILSKLSGTAALVVNSSNQINNGSNDIWSSGDTRSGSGSILVLGNNITSLTLKVYLRGDGWAGSIPENWASTTGNTGAGDGFTLGIGTLESDLEISKTVNNTNPNVGDNVIFNLTAKNNGASNNTDVKVQDLLPIGYTYLSHTAASATTYTPSTGEWNIGNLGVGTANQKTLSIMATVVGNQTGNYTNTAVISTTSGIHDPVSTNNSASAFTIPVVPCNAGTAQVPLTSTVISNNTAPISEELFFEDFGTSDINNGDKGRATTSYMPAGSFQYGSSYLNNGPPLDSGNGNYWGEDERYNKARINDGYYAVVSPNYINQGWYLNDSWSSWWSIINDYSGTATGAALVINAGDNINAFYNRAATVQVGAGYRASFQLYVIPGASPTQLAIDIKDADTDAVIATYTTILYATTEQSQWIPVSLEFTMPGIGGDTTCVSRNVIVSLRNEYAATDGNDYYIDNILLEKILDAPACPPTDGCVDNGITFVNLNSLLEGSLPTGAVLVWFTENDNTGTPVEEPTSITESGTYYAFFYDEENDCYNTNASTAIVTVTIYPPCYCENPGAEGYSLTSTVGILTKSAVPSLAGWPENVPNGYIVLDSHQKGFVITHKTTEQIEALTPVLGMLVYDTDDNCVKLHSDLGWKCIERTCN